jgi:hypothetical protein
MSPPQYYNTGNGLSPTPEYAALLEARVQALKEELEETNRDMSIPITNPLAVDLFIRVDEKGCVCLSSRDIDAIAYRVIELLQEKSRLSSRGGAS